MRDGLVAGTTGGTNRLLGMRWRSIAGMWAGLCRSVSLGCHTGRRFRHQPKPTPTILSTDHVARLESSGTTAASSEVSRKLSKYPCSLPDNTPDGPAKGTDSCALRRLKGTLWVSMGRSEPEGRISGA